jgi:plasmid stabilization system protein ParE
MFIKPRLKEVLGRLTKWPEADQEELALLAREIEARRNGVYQASPGELKAIDIALESIANDEVATDEEVEAVCWKVPPRMKVRYSKYALSDAYSLLAPMAVSSPLEAAHFRARIQLVLEQIGDSLKRAQEVAERPGILRESFLGDSYTVYYKIIENEVVIVRIFRLGYEGGEIKL